MALEQGEVSAAIISPEDNLTVPYRAFLQNGGSANMVVDGSGTPIVFSLAADPTDELSLTELRFVFVTNTLVFGQSVFGSGGGSLSNGVLVETVLSGETSNLGNLTVNDDFYTFPQKVGPVAEFGGNRDLVAVSIGFGPPAIVLEPGSGDLARVTIRDNLTTGTRSIGYFRASVSGTREVL